MAAVAALTPSVVTRYDSTKYDKPCHCPPSVRNLLEQARQGLLDAEYATRSVDRYAWAHRAALRAAAAVLAARARPRRAAQPVSAWVLLARVAPELAEWSTFFAATSATRAAVEAGVHRLVSDRDADDLVRQAGQFLTLAAHAATRTSQ
ncbi:MAG: SAV_6107 family HEPN domain-containing protein [Pseudonocardiaceae bacterium]